MNTEKDLEMYQNNDKDKQEGSENLQQIYFNIQIPKYFSLKNQWLAEINDNTNERKMLYNCEYIGHPIYNVYNELKESKIEKNEIQEVIQLQKISNWASETDYLMDINLKVQSKQATNDNKHVIEIDILSEKNHDVFQSLSCISKVKKEEANSHISTKNRLLPFSLESGRESTSKFNKFQVWKLFQDKHLIPSSKSETQDPNQNPHDLYFQWNSNRFLSKLPEIPDHLLDLLRTKHHGIHKITSEDSLEYIWNAEYLKDFSERFKITNPHPVLISDSGFVGIMVDEHGCVFKWNEMEKDMQYLGPDLITGIENLLFYPDNILYDEMISDEPEFEEEEEGGEEVPMKVINLRMGTKGNKGKKKRKNRKNRSKKR
ncbi:unnamed protein product [Rhizophagus irregularis]|nr:unnamed protein product [Rhizophagus irregularis]